MKAIDCHGFGGGFTLGAVQAGWELEAKLSRHVGFGVINALGNRPLLGQSWESIAVHPSEWEPLDAQLVFGNPPCAAFSTFNTSKTSKGDNSDINNYMWEVIRYAGMVAPPVVIFESVQQTYRKGLKLMRALRAELERISGLEYVLLHVLHNNASLGGCSIRRRYFWVATRVPFGVESCRIGRDGQPYDVDHVPSLNAVLRDLEPLGLTMHPQPYRGVRSVTDSEVRVMNSSEWCRREVHDGIGQVDGHDIVRVTRKDGKPNGPGRIRDLLLDDENPRGVEWPEGANLEDVMRRYLAKNGDLPKSWQYPSKKAVLDEAGEKTYAVDAKGVRRMVTVPIRKDERLIETDFSLGCHQPSRWRGERMARVLTGGGTHDVYHPHQLRTLTHREVSRIMGFPDSWKIWPVRNAPDLGPAWGKGVPVQAARWIAYWARESLEGRPGSVTGKLVGDLHPRVFKDHGGEDRELVVDVTNDYKPFARLIGDHG